ncbi:Gfo/Idh/MocA family protein [Coraliomargarita sp. W4R72]
MRAKGNKVIRVGVIGASGYAVEMLELFRARLHRMEIVGLFAIGQDEAGVGIAKRFGIPVFFDFEKFMLAMSDLAEVVYNASPPHAHVSTTRAAIDVGLAVWLEKPPVTTQADFTLLLDSIEQRQARVEVCFNNLYNPVLIDLGKALSRGQFGRVRAIHTIGGFMRDRHYFNRNTWSGRIEKMGVLIRDGSLSNALSHSVANALFLGRSNQLFDSIANWQGNLYRVLSPESEDTVSLEATGASGISYTFNLSLVVDAPIPPTNIIDTEAGLIYFKNYRTIEYAEGFDSSSLGILKQTELDDDVRCYMLSALCESHLGQRNPAVTFGDTSPFVSFLESVYSTATVDCLELNNEPDASVEMGRFIRENLVHASKQGASVDLREQLNFAQLDRV